MVKEVLMVAVITAGVVGTIAIRECGKVNSIPPVVVAPKPHVAGCHDSTVVVSVDTQVTCDEGAEQTVEYWTAPDPNFGGKWPMTVKCRCY